jgi:metal-responsive CopG/Arc/MetJ family transcriptional regulator
MSAIAIEMTIDETLLQEVDTAVAKLGTTRNAFLHEAVQQALKQLHIAALEQQQIRGYQQLPPAPDEFAVWLDEQVWEQEQV